MRQLLGGDFVKFLGCYTQSPSSGLRLNTLKVGALEQITQGLDPVPWCPSGYVIYPLPGGITNRSVFAHEVGKNSDMVSSPPDVGTLGRHPYHAAGLYYLQDPSAMAAAEILAPQPGERVLDLSAAPGGKSTHLASLMANQGLLVANEIHPQRVWELAENMERWGASNAAITSETPERLAVHFGAFFDRVLVDTPCSGEGMFRKSEAARRDWSPELVQSCALRQSLIMEQAARLVRPGGRLVYSTCTFNPNENEAVVSRFLDRHHDFELLEVERAPGFEPGRPDWLPAEMSATALYLELRGAVRLWPHSSPGEGHFIALLHKVGDIDFPASEVRQKVIKVESNVRRIFSDYCQASLNIDFDPARLSKVGSYLYQLPEGLPRLGSLKVIHPGWWLGKIKTVKDGHSRRFEPSHALAIGLKAEAARRSIDLPVLGTEVQSYLRGETLISQGEDGWVLVTVNGFPLGWGKRARGIIKNYYPRGLRWY